MAIINIAGSKKARSKTCTGLTKSWVCTMLGGRESEKRYGTVPDNHKKVNKDTTNIKKPLTILTLEFCNKF